MNFDALIPIALFICIAYVIKAVVDARVRSRLIGVGGAEELVNSLMRDEEQRRRQSSLRWGIVRLSVSAGVGLIQWYGWQEVSPGVVAVLAAATGLGNLVSFAVARRLG